MAKYLVTYHGSSMPHDPEAMASARAAFMQWAGKTGAALADPGAPVQSARTVPAGGVGEGGTNEAISGWSIVEASDMDAAVALLGDHPFIGRGGVLQVCEPATI
jgi:hypothetical protein